MLLGARLSQEVDCEYFQDKNCTAGALSLPRRARFGPFRAVSGRFGQKSTT